MTNRYSVERTIEASPDVVWRRLTDAEAVPGAGVTTFAMEEVYSGPLAPLMTRAIPDLSESFAQFGDGLKAAAEGTRAPA